MYVEYSLVPSLPDLCSTLNRDRGDWGRGYAEYTTCMHAGVPLTAIEHKGYNGYSSYNTRQAIL